LLFRQKTLNVRGKLLSLDEARIMGILNLTPDSFFDGNRYMNIDDAVRQVDVMVNEGASIIDVGGMSSRPGSAIISSEEEIERIGQITLELVRTFPGTIFSIDTIHSATARFALEAGAGIVNDISGGLYDPDILDVAAEFGAPYICMHMKGTPSTMQRDPDYNDVTQEILDFFVERKRTLQEKGIVDIVFDPGFGFGKTVKHNYELLAGLGIFHMLECPVLAGISRKSMICRVLDVKLDAALNGTTALHMLALQRGANILSVHDVREAAECIRLYAKFTECGGDSDSALIPD